MTPRRLRLVAVFGRCALEVNGVPLGVDDGQGRHERRVGSFVSPRTVTDGRWRGLGQRVDTGRECSCESRPRQVGELAEHSLLHCVDRIRCLFQGSATTLSQFERCGHQWMPREKDMEPRVCPKCKSPYWDKPRRQPKSATT